MADWSVDVIVGECVVLVMFVDDYTVDTIIK